MSSHLVDGSFNHEVGGCLTKTAYRHLTRFISGNRYRLIVNAVDFVRSDNGGDRFTQLERAAAGIGATVIDGTNF